eukprot:65602_1
MATCRNHDFNFPPPPKLTWQLTGIPSDCVSIEPLQLDGSITNHLHGLYLNQETTNTSQCEHQNKAHDDKSQITKSINCDEHNITRTLAQYEHHTNYRMYSRVIMHGFVRNAQAHITSIVPTDIIAMCLSFYFEESNDSIRSAYKLYKHMHREPMGGDKVLSVLGKTDKKNTQILTDLVEFEFIRIVSRKCTFSQFLN